MFFILSKTISFITMPLVIVCFCFLISVLIKNPHWKKLLFRVGLVLLFFVSNDFLANEAIRAWEIETKPYAEMRKYEVGIVLTGATISGLTPTDRVYYHRGADRVFHTVQLYKLGLIKKILISGGTGLLSDVDDPEALKFKKTMLMMCVPEADILTESETRNTHESAVAVKKILRDLKYNEKDCLLITSAFHMRRSLACYRKVGLNLDNFTVDFYGHKRAYNIDAFIVPTVEAIVIWHKLMKEWIGFAAYKAAGYI